MNIFDPNIPFDENKPFYPLVLSYVAQLHGFIELASRGFKLHLEEIKSRRFGEHVLTEQISSLSTDKEKQVWEAVNQGGITGLIGKQELGSKVVGTGIKINIELLAKATLMDHKAYLDHFMRMSSGSLMILAYETTKDYHTHDPLWEFLRHCRNAAAHKGYFNLLHGEPRRMAKWRGIEIVSSLQGTPLFFDSIKLGFLGIGDTLYLLSDIEQAFPNIK
jgi:hypothetical protein